MHHSVFFRYHSQTEQLLFSYNILHALSTEVQYDTKDSCVVYQI